MDYVAIQKMIFSLVGGLGIFLLGMRHMSDGLQTVSGPSLRRLIASVTGNRLMAAAVGVVVTCIVQSSSVSTVMTIGLVNSGIMTLTQALGVIVGANIGTTVTGWILVLKVGAWGLPILGVAAFVFLFSKNEKRRYLALAIMGVGMVFFGLEIMKGGVKVIRSIPEFEQAFTYFAATSYLGVLKCALAGCLLTILVQSSSATLAITIALASQGVINFESAAALVLGENIGTTITAYLASLGASANARRAAYFHVLFNVVGVFVITLLFQAYLPFVKWIVSTAFGVENVSAAIIEDGATVYPYAVTGIAVTHSVFNIVNTCAFLPFLPFIAGLLERLVSEKTEVRQKLLTHLDYHHFETPVAALEMSGREIDKMAKYSRESFDDLIAYADADEERGSEVAERVFSQEANLDVAQGEVTEFLANLMGEAISHEDVEISKNQLRLADEYESVGDYIVAILKLHLRMRDNDSSFRPGQLEGIRALHDAVGEYFDQVNACTVNDARIEDMGPFEAESDRITEQIRTLRSEHWERIAAAKVDPMGATIYSDVLQSYRKVKDHLLNIAEVHAGLK
jgi:phosphate:Na+ symporter